MGNTELKNGFKESSKFINSNNKLGLTPDILFEEDLIESVTKYIKDTIKVQDFQIDVAFPEGNHQLNENSEENYKRLFISELSESLINGYVTSSGNLEMLKEPAFQQYFTVINPQSATKFSQIQRQKFVILYALFLEKFKEQQDKKINFFEYIQRFLTKSDVTDRIQVGLESGFKFSLALLKEIQTVNKDMLINSLEYLYQTLRQSQPGSLYSTDKLSFMIDANLNDARQFLVSIIEDLKSDDRAVELAYKIILLIGIARSNIEDLLIVSTLLDKQNAQVDLRAEIEMLKTNGSSEKQVKLTDLDLKDIKLMKKSKLFFMVAGAHQQQVKKGFALTTDGENIYYYHPTQGIYKLSAGSQVGQMSGQIYNHVKDFRPNEKISLLYVNGKLLCRSDTILKTAPFVTLNTVTLEEETSAERNSNKMSYVPNPNIERELIPRSMFTDGNYIYIPTLKSTKQTDQQNDEENQENQATTQNLTIEVYDASTPLFDFVREIQIVYNEDNDEKFEDSLKLHKRTNFATNGQMLYMHNPNHSYVYYFDMNNGQQVQKVSYNGEKPSKGRSTYDYQNNTFYQINFGDDANLYQFQINNFQKSGSSSGFVKEFQDPRIQSFKQQIYNEQYQHSNANLSSSLNLIERIMQNVTTPILIHESKEISREFQKIPLLPRLQRTLILGSIDSACTGFFYQLEVLKQSGLTNQEIEDKLLSFFKHPNATYLTSTLFKLLQVSLDRNNVIISQKKTALNLHDQYSFYFLLRILKANFDALNLCGITIADLLKLKESFDDFMDAYKMSVVRIIEKGYNTEFEEGPYVQEMTQLWEQIYQVCLQTLSSSINLIYSSNSEIIENLNKSLSGPMNDKLAENCGISINYLSQPQVVSQILDQSKVDQAQVKQLLTLASKLSTEHYKRTFSAIDLKKPETFCDPLSTLIASCNSLIKSLCEQTLIQYCSVSEFIASKAGQQYANQQNDKQKLASLESLLIHIISILGNDTSSIVSVAISQYHSILTLKKENPDETCLNKEFTEFLDQVLQFNSKNLSTVALYVQSFSLFKPNVKLTQQLQASLGRLLGEISGYYEINKKYRDIIDTTGCDLHKYLTNITRSTSWFLSMLAYKLIKVKEDVPPGEEKQKSARESAYDLIIQSDLLSGGLQPKYLHLFSTDSQAQLSELIKITQEKQLIAQVNSGNQPETETEEERLLSATINKGKNVDVDRVITYLQQLLERKVPMVPYARLGGEDGFRLSRAAFAVMIKFSSEGLDRWSEFIDEMDMLWSELEGDDDRDFKFKDAIKKHKGYEAIQKRWESASKMRQWVNEKKKNLMEKIRKQVESQYLVDKEAQPKPEPVAPVEENKDQDAVQIDTSTKPSEPAPTSGSGLTEADKEKIEELSDVKFISELQVIYDKIIEKAEFLVKLYVPESLKIKDQLSNKIGGLLFIRDIQSMENIENSLGGSSKFNWRDRLKQWKQVQTSKGAIKSFTDKRKEIFDSSTTSILACLQTPITTQRIKKQVETAFLNATKRVSGLKILNNLLQLELPSDIRIDVIQWFNSSLRGNKNQLTHYLDDLKGCGEILDDLSRANFFQIIKSLVAQLRQSKEINEIKVIISALKWKYTARDHGYLRGLDIFRILHEGNGESDNILKNCWGQHITRKIISDEDQNQIQQDVLQLFEQIYLLTIGRIVQTEEGAQIKIKSTGTSVPTLTKAQSMIDENVSEYLVAQSFEVIFKEFGTYIKSVKNFEGLDWVKYARKRNRDIKDGNKPTSEMIQEFETLLAEDKKEEDSVKEHIDEQEDQSVTDQRAKEFAKTTIQAFKLYNEKFLGRLLRLVDIFTSIATTKQHPLQMVQRVATPYQVETLLNLLVYSSPRNKISSIKILENLIKIQLPFEILEEGISILTREKNSVPYKILNETIPKAELKESLFLKFVYNYILESRHKMWYKQGPESEGQFAVSQELINLLRTIYENAPQEELQHAIREKMRRYFTQPIANWNIEESDILLSILPFGGFTRLMMGSYATYKETQRCIVLGFSEKVQADQDLGILDSKVLEELQTTIYCGDANKVKALVLFVGHGDATFIPEVRALEVGDLVPNIFSNKGGKLSILYENDILKNFIDILRQDLTGQSSLVLRQSQCQILKAITYLVENEQKENNASDFLRIMKEQGFLNELIQFLQRNANRPQIQNKNEQNLPNELLEIALTTLRIKALESNGSIIKSSDIRVHIGDSLVTFFIPQTKDDNGKLQSSVLRNVQIEASLNQASIPTQSQNKAYIGVQLSYLKSHPELALQQQIECLIIDTSDTFTGHDDEFFLQAIQNASIVLVTDSTDIEKIYFTLKQYSVKHQAKLSNPLHLKPVIQITHSDLRSILQTKEPHHIQSETRNEQYSKFVDELQEWANFTEEQVTKIKSGEKTEDKTVEACLKLQKKLQTQGVDASSQLNIKKLLVGRMASLQRRQTSNNDTSQVFEDFGVKVWDESFANMNIVEVFDKFRNAEKDENIETTIQKERIKAFAAAFNVKKIDEDGIHNRYVDTLNKILRQRSRTTLISFLEYLEPLPVIELRAFNDLDKLLLLSYNEALNIKNLTGDKNFLTQVKTLLRRMIQDPNMRDFIYNFMSTNILKPTQQVINKMINDKEFLVKEVFESEVDSQIYPLPLFVCSIMKLVLKYYPDLFGQIRGLLPNAVSLLFALALARSIKDIKYSNQQVKFVTVAAKLLTFARCEKTTYKDTLIQDVAQMKILALFSEKLNQKLQGSKAKEQVKIVKEIFYEWEQIRSLQETIDNSKVAIYDPKQQSYNFAKRVNFLKTKDPVLFFQLYKNVTGALQQVHDKISSQVKTLTSHPSEVRVPFISKVKSYNGASAMSVKRTVTDSQPDDKFTFFYDQYGKQAELPTNSEFEKRVNHLYFSYQKQNADNLFYFGFAKKGRLNGSYQDESYKEVETYPNFNYPVKQLASCKNASIILREDGYCFQTGNIGQNSVSAPYEERTYWDGTICCVSAGKRNLALATKRNLVCFFGGNKNNHYSTANHETSNWYKAKWIDGLEAEDSIVDISSGNHFTMLVTKKGYLYGTGDIFMDMFFQKPHDGDAGFVKVPLGENQKALAVYCSKDKLSKCCIVDIQEGSERYLMSIGTQFTGVLGVGEPDFLKQLQKLDYDHANIKFVKVSLQTNHVMAITESGELYGWGSNIGYRLGLDFNHQIVNKPIPIPFFSEPSRIKVINVACGDDHSLVQVEELDDVTHSWQFRTYQVGYNQDEVNSAHRGVTKDKVEQACFTSNSICRINRFDGLKAKAMACGHSTSFIYLVEADSSKSNLMVDKIVKNEILPEIFRRGYLHMYIDTNNIQDNLPMLPQEEEFSKDNINELEMQQVSRASLLSAQEEDKNETEEQIALREAQRKAAEQKRADRIKKREAILVKRQQLSEKDPSKEGWHFYNNSDLTDKQLNFPRVSIAIRHTVPTLYDNLAYFKTIFEQAMEAVDSSQAAKFTDETQHGVLCSETGKPIVGKSRYYASYQVGEELKEVHLSEEAFAEPTEQDHMPLIYFRLTHQLKADAKLPIVDLKEIYKTTGLKFTVEIKCQRQYFSNKQALVDMFKDVQEQDMMKKNFLSILKNPETGYEKQVIAFMQESIDPLSKEFEKDLWDNKKEILKYIKDGKSDDLSEDLKKVANSLKKFVTEENYPAVQQTFFNMIFTLFLSKKVLLRISERNLKSCHSESLPYLRKNLIGNLAGYQKNEILNSMISSLPSGERFEVTIRRRKAYAFAQTGGVDHEGVHTIFGQIMQCIKKSPNNRNCFRMNSVDSQILKVEFKGEGSIDAGGPYRETLTNICNELQSAVLPLLIPTPNNKNNHGQYRECWMINPSSTSPSHLDLFKHFGYFIGAAIRSQQALPLDLAPIFWKLLIDETDTETDAEREMDLKAFDTYSWQVIEDLRSNAKGLSDEDFEAAFEENFVTLLSNGTQVEVIPGGRTMKVTKQNLDEYIRLVVLTRINESQKQIKAIKEGINFVINLNICKFLNAKQIETRATGSKSLNIEHLKRITVYEGGASANDSHISIFWQVLESFNDEERSLYLKFVWGRARLPASTDQKHKIVYLTYNPNACLPVSHTCFFTLDMPRYPTFEIARDRILFAIRFCGDIDADRSSHDIGSDD